MSLPAASATEPGTESDVELAVRLAREAGHLLVSLREAMWRDGAHVVGRDGPRRRRCPRVHRPRAAAAPSRRRRARRGGQGGPAPLPRRSGVDHRSARRHARVRRAGPARLGGARRAVGSRPLRRRRGRAPGGRPRARHRSGARAARRSSAIDRASSPPATGPRTPPCSSPTHSAATPCGSVRPGPRRWPSCSARPTSTCTTAGCTSGTRPPRRPSRSPAGLHVSRLDGTPMVFNARDPWLPDLIICRPELADAGARRALGPLTAAPRLVGWTRWSDRLPTVAISASRPSRPPRDPMRLAIPAIASAAAARAARGGCRHPRRPPRRCRASSSRSPSLRVRPPCSGSCAATGVAGWLLVSVNLVAVAGWIVTRLTGIRGDRRARGRRAPAARRLDLGDPRGASPSRAPSPRGRRAHDRCRRVRSRTPPSSPASSWCPDSPTPPPTTTPHERRVRRRARPRRTTPPRRTRHGDVATDAPVDDGHDAHRRASSRTATSTARSATCSPTRSAPAPLRPTTTATRGRGRGIPPPTRSSSRASTGVTAEQQARAEQLVRDTLRDLPVFADVTTVGEFGYQSIGDAEHGLRALRQLLAHQRRHVPRPDATRVARVPGRRRSSARWCRRCSSPATARSTIPNSSTSAAR